MFYQYNMQSETHPHEQELSCFIYHTSAENSTGFGLHCHLHNEMILVMENIGIYSINGDILHLKKGDILFFPSMVAHELFATYSTGASMVIQFSNSFLFAPQLQLNSINLLAYTNKKPKNFCDYVISRKDNAVLDECFTRLEQICMLFPAENLREEDKTTGFGLCSDHVANNTNYMTQYYWQMKSAILNILSELIRIKHLKINTSEDTSHSNLKSIEQLVFELIEHPEKNVTLKQAAEYTNMSYHYFPKVFKKVFSCTFVEYKNHLRILKAKTLLAQTDDSIEEIAYATNFGNVTYFNRIFKQINEISPNEYRKKYKIR